MAKIVCSVCGSDDVQAKVWTKPNENFKITCDFIDELITEPADCWCCDCEENQKLIIIDGNESQPTIIPETLRCEECGSIEVQIQAWVDPNQNNKFISDCEDYKSSWCDGCESHVKAIPHKEFMEEVVDYWWKHLDNGEDKEVVTGLKTEDYDPANDYQAFDIVCDEIWAVKTDEEKIAIWKTITQREGGHEE